MDLTADTESTDSVRSSNHSSINMNYVNFTFSLSCELRSVRFSGTWHALSGSARLRKTKPLSPMHSADKSRPSHRRKPSSEVS